MRNIAVAMLLVAFAGFSGGCSQGSQDDPSQDKAFADQLSQASAGGKKPRPQMPGTGKEVLQHMHDASKPGEKPGASDTSPKATGSSTVAKPTGADSKASGN